MNVFVVNTGSSSVKFQIINTDLEMFENDTDEMVAKGIVERIGKEDAIIKFEAIGQPQVTGVEPIYDHKEAIRRIKKWIEDENTEIKGVKGWDDIQAVGHRCVHGGEKFTKSVLITDEVIKMMEECSDLAPLHNPANIKGIEACREIFPPEIPQVGVFDTAFHSTMPEEVYLYAIPYEFYEKYRIRRYGFHGTSHRYVAYKYRKIKGLKREEVNVITAHLGNGSSISAIKNGVSIFNSMGMTPIEGLIMGTRCGDIDAGIIEYLVRKGEGDLNKVMEILQKKSGMLGISGISNDMRDIEDAAEKENRRALLSLKMFAMRVKRYIGSCYAMMGGANAVIFTGGIGENDSIIRELTCEGLECLGIYLDKEKNNKMFKGKMGPITKDGSKCEVWVIPTNEELLIARDTVRVIKDVPREW